MLLGTITKLFNNAFVKIFCKYFLTLFFSLLVLDEDAVTDSKENTNPIDEHIKSSNDIDYTEQEVIEEKSKDHILHGNSFHNHSSLQNRVAATTAAIDKNDHNKRNTNTNNNNNKQINNKEFAKLKTSNVDEKGLVEAKSGSPLQQHQSEATTNAEQQDDRSKNCVIVKHKSRRNVSDSNNNEILSQSSAANSRANTTVMNSHATATQNGQTTVVGHHRGFSQPTVTVATSSTGGDPWFLQSTGHQMPPTAPLRHNKRPAPQPATAAGSITNPNNLLVNSGSGGIGVGGGITSNITLQQQFSQSQPHIVAQSANLSATSHHNNVVINNPNNYRVAKLPKFIQTPLHISDP